MAREKKDQNGMDHISRALERASEEKQSVRDWVRPQSQVKATPRVALDGAVVELDPAVLENNHVIYDSKVDPRTTDTYRLLRTRVLQTMQANGWTKLGITSPGPKSGKTLNAINLALAIAREGASNVLLVDADFRRPAVAKTLGLDTETGITEYLTGDMPLEQILLRPSIADNLAIMPGSNEPEQEANPELMGSEKMRGLLASFGDARSQNLVIVDLPPVLVGDDVIALTPSLDAVLLVVAEGITNVDELKRTTDLLSGTNLVGTVLNNSLERHDGLDGYYAAD